MFCLYSKLQQECYILNRDILQTIDKLNDIQMKKFQSIEKIFIDLKKKKKKCMKSENIILNVITQ